MAGDDGDSLDWERVLPVDRLREGRRCVRLKSGRGILVLSARGNVYAMDHACYHHGGPLLSGDIEDIGDHVVISCPWHQYKIDLKTGEGIYLGIDPTKIVPGRRPRAEDAVVKSKGQKQRVHHCRVKDGFIEVAESTPSQVASAFSDALHKAGGVEGPSLSTATSLGKVHAPHGGEGLVPARAGGSKKKQIPIAQPGEEVEGWLPSDGYAGLPFA